MTGMDALPRQDMRSRVDLLVATMTGQEASLIALLAMTMTEPILLAATMIHHHVLGMKSPVGVDMKKSDQAVGMTAMLHDHLRVVMRNRPGLPAMNRPLIQVVMKNDQERNVLMNRLAVVGMNRRQVVMKSGQEKTDMSGLLAMISRRLAMKTDHAGLVMTMLRHRVGREMNHGMVVRLRVGDMKKREE